MQSRMDKRRAGSASQVSIRNVRVEFADARHRPVAAAMRQAAQRTNRCVGGPRRRATLFDKQNRIQIGFGQLVCRLETINSASGWACAGI